MQVHNQPILQLVSYLNVNAHSYVHEGVYVCLRLHFSPIFAIPFFKMETLSENATSCCHRTHSWHLMQMEKQTLRVNKARI